MPYASVLEPDPDPVRLKRAKETRKNAAKRQIIRRKKYFIFNKI
jgi:hypothetical protein